MRFRSLGLELVALVVVSANVTVGAVGGGERRVVVSCRQVPQLGLHPICDLGFQVPARQTPPSPMSISVQAKHPPRPGLLRLPVVTRSQNKVAGLYFRRKVRMGLANGYASSLQY